jgi:hypothetical protein
VEQGCVDAVDQPGRDVPDLGLAAGADAGKPVVRQRQFAGPSLVQQGREQQLEAGRVVPGLPVTGLVVEPGQRCGARAMNRRILVALGQVGQGQHRAQSGKQSLFGERQGVAEAAVRMLGSDQPAHAFGVGEERSVLGASNPCQEGGVVGRTRDPPLSQPAEQIRDRIDSSPAAAGGFGRLRMANDLFFRVRPPCSTRWSRLSWRLTRACCERPFDGPRHSPRGYRHRTAARPRPVRASLDGAVATSRERPPASKPREAAAFPAYNATRSRRTWCCGGSLGGWVDRPPPWS